MNMNVKFYETIARYYDAENASMTADFALHSELASEYGDPVLDVGCGSGRVMLHLAREGFRVVGVDYSAAMLARGRQHVARLPDDVRARVTFVHGDALSVALPGGPFRLISVPYNGFMHFQALDDQLAALRRFRALLADGGALLLDLPNAGEAYGTQDDGALVLERTFIEPESGNLVLQHSVSELDRIEQQLHVTWIYDEVHADGAVHRTLAPLVLRYVFPGELRLLLAAAGFALVALYGSYEQDPFEDGSPRMIVLAEGAQSA